MEIENNTRRLAKYIRQNLSKGYSMDSLRWALVRQGYSRPIVERAIELVEKELTIKQASVNEKPIIEHQILDENDNPIEVKPSLFRRIITYFKKSN